jgi:hypothetical protein
LPQMNFKIPCCLASLISIGAGGIACLMATITFSSSALSLLYSLCCCCVVHLPLEDIVE